MEKEEEGREKGEEGREKGEEGRGKEEGSIHTAKKHSPPRVYACTDETLCFPHCSIGDH